MKGLVSVALREFIERRSVAVAALAAALLPIILPFIPGITNWPAGDIRGSMAWVMSLGLSWVLAVFFGAGIIGSDLSAGRIGFYLTRPISAPAIWLGKVMATYVIVVGCEILVLLPAIIIPGSESYFTGVFDGPWFLSMGFDGPWWFMGGLLFAVPLFLILAAHALGIMFRARSLWFFLDLAAFFAVAWLYLSHTVKFMNASYVVFVTSSILFAVMFIVALLFAGGTQIAFGRADIKRGHRMLSLSLWAIMGLSTLAFVGYSTWFFAVTPDDLVEIRGVEAGPVGDWISVRGSNAGRLNYQTSYLYNLSNGEYFDKTASMNTSFSSNRNVAAWCAETGPNLFQIEYADFSSGQLQRHETKLVFSIFPETKISPEGRNILVQEGDSLSIFELESGRLLTAAVLPEYSRLHKVVFTAEDVVLAFVSSWQESNSNMRSLDIYQLSTDGLNQVGALGEVGWSAVVMVAPDASRVFLAHRMDSGLVTRSMHELPTGRVQISFPAPDTYGPLMFFRDGRFVQAKFVNGVAWLECESAADAEPVSINLGMGERVAIGGQLHDGRVVVGIGSSWELATMKSYVVDLESGDVIFVDGALRPAIFQHHFFDTLPSPAASTLFIDENKALVRWDPETGKVSRILGGVDKD